MLENYLANDYGYLLISKTMTLRNNFQMKNQNLDVAAFKVKFKGTSYIWLLSS